MESVAVSFGTIDKVARVVPCSCKAELAGRPIEIAERKRDERTHRIALVRAVQRSRRRRGQFLDPMLFADPAWDMLLELYASHLEQRRISVSSLCIASHVPATTALRWIAKIEQDGLAVRRDDPNDGRRSWIELTDDGFDRMDRYFETQAKCCISL